MGYRFDPNLGEPVSESWRELLFAVITTRVHGGNDAESLLGVDGLPAWASFDSNGIALQEFIEPFKDTVLSGVDFINEQNTSIKHGLNDNTIDEFELGIWIGVGRWS